VHDGIIEDGGRTLRVIGISGPQCHTIDTGREGQIILAINTGLDLCHLQQKEQGGGRREEEMIAKSVVVVVVVA